MSKDYSVNFDNGVYYEKITNNDFKGGITEDDFSTNKAFGSIFSQLDLDGDGELSQNELNRVADTVGSAADQDGTLTKKGIKNIIKQLGLKHVNAENFTKVLSKIKFLSAKIGNNPINVIKNKYNVKNNQIKELGDGTYQVNIDDNNKFICAKNGRKLEELKNGEILYRFQTEGEDSSEGRYKNTNGDTIGWFDKQGNMMCQPQLDDTFDSTMKSLGITDAKDIQTILDANSFISDKNQSLFEKNKKGFGGTLHNIKIPSEIVDKYGVEKFLRVQNWD